MTHFARFFKCFRRPALCLFGNNNNNCKRALCSMLLYCIISNSLVSQQDRHYYPIFQMKSPRIRQIKEMYTGRWGPWIIWIINQICLTSQLVNLFLFFTTRRCLFREFGEIKVFPKLIGITVTKSLTADVLASLVDALFVPLTVSGIYLKPLLPFYMILWQ